MKKTQIVVVLFLLLGTSGVFAAEECDGVVCSQTCADGLCTELDCNQAKGGDCKCEKITKALPGGATMIFCTTWDACSFGCLDDGFPGFGTKSKDEMPPFRLRAVPKELKHYPELVAALRTFGRREGLLLNAGEYKVSFTQSSAADADVYDVATSGTVRVQRDDANTIDIEIEIGKVKASGQFFADGNSGYLFVDSKVSNELISW